MNADSALARHSTRRRFRLAVVAASVVAAIVGSVVLATHHSGATVTTRGVAETLRVPSHPGWVVSGPGALWLALADERLPIRDRPLLQIDLASAAVKQSILLGGQVLFVTRDRNRLLASVQHVGGDGSGPSLVDALDWRSGRVLLRRQFPTALGPLAVSGNDLWALQVRPAALLRLDLETLVPTAPPLPLASGRALGLAVGAGHVWTTAPDTGEVLRIDPARRAIKRAHVGGFPTGVAVTEGSVWFADRDRGEVRRLDPSTLEPDGEPIRVGGEPTWLARAGRYLFVGDASAGTVTRVDVHSGSKAGPPIRVAPPADDAPAFVVVPAGRSVWVSSFTSNTLTRISATSSSAAPPAITATSAQAASTNAGTLPRGGRVVASITVPEMGGAFTVGEGAVWAASDVESTLLRIDPKTNAIVARIKIGASEAATAGNGAVWLSHPLDDTVSRIDPATNTVTATIHVGPHPEGVAVSPGAVWVANAYGPSVSRIDPRRNRVVATIKVGPHLACCAEHMSVIVGGGALWVAVPNANEIVRVDPRTNKVTDGVKLPYPPCGFLVADASAVWSAGGGCEDTVARIDPRTKRLTAKLSEPHPVGLGLDVGSVWVAVLGSANVDRIDPRRGHIVARLPVGGIPVRLAVGFGSVWINDDEGRVLRIQPQS